MKLCGERIQKINWFVTGWIDFRNRKIVANDGGTWYGNGVVDVHRDHAIWKNQEVSVNFDIRYS